MRRSPAAETFRRDRQLQDEHTSSQSSMADALGDYLDAVSRIPLLTPSEEVHLAQRVQRWQTGGPGAPTLERAGRRALNRMVQANLRLVVSIARRYHCATVERMDLIQAGNLGLMRAVEKFDPTRGYRFSTYAFWWIRQAISRHLREQGGTIRLPSELIDLAARVSQLQNASPTPPQPAAAGRNPGGDRDPAQPCAHGAPALPSPLPGPAHRDPRRQLQPARQHSGTGPARRAGQIGRAHV